MAEDQAIAVAHRPRRHAQAMCVDALAYQIGVLNVGGNGTVPQHVGGLGSSVLALALMPFALAAGRFLALPDGALLGRTQRGRRFRAPGMAGAGPPAAELAGRHMVSKQHGPPVARATTVAFHMEANQCAIGIERVAAARVRHDAVRVHGLQERGHDVLRGMRCVHSTEPLGTWIGPRRPMAANVLCSFWRAQVTQRPTDAVRSGCDGRWWHDHGVGSWLHLQHLPVPCIPGRAQAIQYALDLRWRSQIAVVAPMRRSWREPVFG
ncbi:MAG TPA: hypothetical protein DC051_15425 [Stenotrophomonas maltophilia]|nr:hypothetical protein [Stenotrophomonas maltophilia]